MEPHSILDTLIPVPRRRELDHIDLAAPSLEVWDALHGGRIAWPRLVRALQHARTRSLSAAPLRRDPPLALGELRSTPGHPGVQLLTEEPGQGFTLAAVAAMRVVTFELLPVADREAFTRFAEPGLVRLVWRVDISPIGSASCRLRIELRVDAGDSLSWRRFRRLYIVLGPMLRLLRRRLLASLADRFGAAELNGVLRRGRPEA
ncbi:MAG TPA: hypothetical protein VMG12_10935 [Polyangiaceae bacterium]|nr:hypothetical protein [Polyangiaceae bacterium]